MFSLSISLPNDDPQLWRSVADAVEGAGGDCAEIRRKLFVRDLLDYGSDEEILGYFQPRVECPIVMARVYGGGGRIHWGREINGTGHHDRRPVIMRGAKDSVINRYALSSSGNPAGYCEALFWRFARLKRLNILSQDDWHEIGQPILAHIFEKYPRASRSTARLGSLDFVTAFDRNLRVLKGKRIWIRNEAKQNFDALARIVSKFSKLEDRREAASKHFKARMAEATAAQHKRKAA